MSKNNYLNSKALTVGLITAVTMVCAIAGFAMVGATSMSTAAYGAILGGVIGIVVGNTIDHYYGTELSSIIAGVSAVIGGILGAIYGKNKQEDNEDDPDNPLPDPSFTKGAGCLVKTVINHASELNGCLNNNLIDCFKSLDGFPEIVTCMGEDNNNFDNLA